MIKKRTPSNLGHFTGFYLQNVMDLAPNSAGWVTLLLCGLLIYGCSEVPDDERYIQGAMQDIEAAAEAKSTGDILDYLSEDFLGNKVLRKVNIKGMLFLHFRRHKNVHVFLREVSVKVEGDKAEVSCQVILAGRDEKIIPERARILLINSNWQKRNGDWLIVSANWKDPILDY